MLRVARILTSAYKIAQLFKVAAEYACKLASYVEFGEGATGWFKQWAAQPHFINGREVYPPIKLDQDRLIYAMARTAATPFNYPDESFIRELIADKLIQLDNPSSRVLKRIPAEPAKSISEFIDIYLQKADDTYGIDTPKGIEDFNRMFYGAIIKGIQKYIIEVLSALSRGKDVRYTWKKNENTDSNFSPAIAPIIAHDATFLGVLQESAESYSEPMGQLINFMKDPQKGNFLLPARNRVKKTIQDFAQKFLKEHPEYLADLKDYLIEYAKYMQTLFTKKQTDPEVKVHLRTQKESNIEEFLKYLKLNGSAVGSKVRNTTTFGNSNLDNHTKKLLAQGYNILVEDMPSMALLTPEQYKGMEKAGTLFRHRKYTLLGGNQENQTVTKDLVTAGLE